MLKPGGWIAGSVPNRYSLLLGTLKGDFPPNHFLRFNKRSLESLIKSSDLEVLYILKVYDISLVLNHRLGYKKLRDYLLRLISGREDIDHKPVDSIVYELRSKSGNNYRASLIRFLKLVSKFTIISLNYIIRLVPNCNFQLYFQGSLKKTYN
ncbi:MAG: hypothetical protein NZM44_07240 [Candidatus Calescibacterium sp.]|nr:hypothetical protein [Candidatus Calescibacterium sp.]